MTYRPSQADLDVLQAKVQRQEPTDTPTDKKIDPCANLFHNLKQQIRYRTKCLAEGLTTLREEFPETEDQVTHLQEHITTFRRMLKELRRPKSAPMLRRPPPLQTTITTRPAYTPRQPSEETLTKLYESGALTPSPQDT